MRRIGCLTLPERVHDEGNPTRQMGLQVVGEALRSDIGHQVIPDRGAVVELQRINSSWMKTQQRIPRPILSNGVAMPCVR